MRTSHKLTRLVLALMSLVTLVSAGFAQIFNPGGVVATPPGNINNTNNANFPTPQPPGFRGDWNNRANNDNNGANQFANPSRNAVNLNADPPAQIQVSDQKPGSILVYPYYTSNSGTGANTWVTFTNTSQTDNITVHVFFIEGVGCTQADQFMCLTRNASMQLRASDFDPDVAKGWILAVAVDSATGKPTQRNFLIGNAFVNAGNYVGNYGAESFTAYSNTATTGTVNAAPPALPGGAPGEFRTSPGCRLLQDAGGNIIFASNNGYNGNGYIPGLFDDDVAGGTAGLNFTGPPTFCWADSTSAGIRATRTFQLNGGGYDFVPNRFAVEIQSPVDVAGQMVITVGLDGNLTQAGLTGAGQVGTGQVINGNESPFGSFVRWLLGSCQAMATIDNNNPRVPRGMNALIPLGQVGTMQFAVGDAVGIIMTPRGQPKATSGIRTLHKTNVDTGQRLASNNAAGNTVVNFIDLAGNPGTQTIRSPLRYGAQLVIPVFLPPGC